MRRSVIAIPILLLATTSLATVGLTAQSASSTDPDGRTYSALSAYAEGVSLAADNHTDESAGVSIDPDGASVDVYETPMPSASQLRSDIAAVANPTGILVHYINVLNTWNTLDAKVNQLSDNFDSLRAQGITLSAWWPNFGLNKVEVSLQTYSSAAATVIYNQFGNTTVSVSTSSRNTATFAAGRYSDNSPWWGADELSTTKYNGVADCTSGLGMVGPAGGQYIVTAGHCWPNNTPIYNGGRQVGNTSNREWVQGSHADVELVTVLKPFSAGVELWDNFDVQSDDCCSSTIERWRHAQEVPGDRVCVDGANKRLVCGLIIDKVGACITFNEDDGGGYFRQCGLAVLKPPMLPAIQGGDSGGPVFNGTDMTGSKVSVHGTIVGYDGTVGYYDRMLAIQNTYPTLRVICSTC